MQNNSGKGGSKKDRNKTHVCSFDTTVEVIDDALCDTDGKEIRKCSCGKTSFEIIEAKGHTYTSWTTTKGPTCTMSGTNTITCTTCGATDTKSIDKTNHIYSKRDFVSGSVNMRRYECFVCADTFVISTELEESLKHAPSSVFNCPENFSFYVLCDQNEAYIRENLSIFNAYFESSEQQYIDEAVCEYTLQKVAGDVWRVFPVKAYEAGNTYTALRSGSVIFKDYALGDLQFSIFKEDTSTIEVNEDIIFIGELEESSPGYYPFNIKYYETSDTYWLTLKKVDSLNVGDIICVGTAKSFDDMLNAEEKANTFAQITSIEYVDHDNCYLLALKAPSLGDIFTELDIYQTKIDDTAAASIDWLDFEQAVTDAILNDEDFISFAGASYASVIEYTETRQLASKVSNFKDFLNSIQIDKTRTQMPEVVDGVITARITVIGSINIPVTLMSDDSEVGSIVISFEASVSLDYLRLTTNLKCKKATDIFKLDLSNLDIGVTQSVTVSFQFNVEASVEYSMESKPYVYNLNSNIYHYVGCKSVAAMQMKNMHFITTEELLAEYVEGTATAANQCQSCKPITALMTDYFIIDNKKMQMHIPDCQRIQTSKKTDLYISTKAYDNLMAMGYTNCTTCHPHSRYSNTLSESLLSKIQTQDFGSSADEIKKVCDEIKNSDTDKNITLAKIPFKYGVFSVTTEISMYVDFKLEVSLEYKYEMTMVSAAGIRNTSTGFKPYFEIDANEKEHYLSLLGKARFDVGTHLLLKASFVGLEDALYVGFNAKLGFYAKVHGALQIDFTNNDNNYAAAYFESGMHFEIYATAKCPFVLPKEQKFDIKEEDYPLLKLGYGTLCYNYAEVPETITITSDSYSLDGHGLWNTKCYDLVEMKQSTLILNYLGEEGKYSIHYSLENGSNCRIENGVIKIIDTSKSFTDKLTITVIGLDEWKNYTSYTRTAFILPTVTIDIVFNGVVAHTHVYTNGYCDICGAKEPGDTPSLAPSEGLSYDSYGTYYAVTGIGSCDDKEIVIPSTHNGLPVTHIDNYAFESLPITSVVIPNTVTHIGRYAFYECTNLTNINIPDSVIGIRYMAFGFSGLTSVTIPKNVRSLEDLLFFGCQNLTSITVDTNNQYYKSIDGNIYTKDGKTLLQYAIGKKATSFVIPSGITNIGLGAFASNQNLVSVTIPNSVTSIGDGAFGFCTSLKTITIPNSVTYIGEEAFTSCESLTTVIIGTGVETIESYAFGDCKNLTDIKYRGSSTDWFYISKSYYWDYGSDSYTITYNYTGT